MIDSKRDLPLNQCTARNQALTTVIVIATIVVSSPSEHRPKTPAYASKQYSQEILQAYISGKNSAHKHYQNDLIEICTEKTHRRDSCMKGVWEVLDEGVRGSQRRTYKKCYKLQG